MVWNSQNDDCSLKKLIYCVVIIVGTLSFHISDNGLEIDERWSGYLQSWNRRRSIRWRQRTRTSWSTLRSQTAIPHTSWSRSNTVISTVFQKRLSCSPMASVSKLKSGYRPTSFDALRYDKLFSRSLKSRHKSAKSTRAAVGTEFLSPYSPHTHTHPWGSPHPRQPW